MPPPTIDPAIDELPLDPALAPSTPLSQAVYRLYRQIAQHGEALATAKAELQREHAREQAAFRRRLARLALEVFHLERCVAAMAAPLAQAGLVREQARLDMVLTRWRHALAANGVELPELTGAPFDDALADMAEVLASIPGPTEQQRVKEVVEPLVRVDGEVTLRPVIVVELPGG